LPVTEIPLDSSTREEDVIILHGRNLLLKLIERPDRKRIISEEENSQLLSTDDLCYKGFREIVEKCLRWRIKVGCDLRGSFD